MDISPPGPSLRYMVPCTPPKTDSIHDDMDMSPPSPLTPTSDGIPSHPSPPRRRSSRVPVPTSRVLTNDGLNPARPQHSTPLDINNPPERSSNGDKSSTKKLLDYQDADVVICSSDACEFHVPKVFLTKSSLKLDSLIHTASCPSETTKPVDTETPIPVVHLPEGSTVIYSLLSFMLPISPVLPPTLEETMELLSVAQRYDLAHVLVHIRGSVALKDPPLVNKNNALHVYSLARTYCLHREMVQAARITLKFTLTFENLQDKLDLVPSDHLHELWRYHQRVKASLMGTTGEFRDSGACAVFGGCALGSYQIPRWINDYILSMAATPSLFDFTEFQRVLAQHTSIASNGTGDQGCSFCAHLPGWSIDEFWGALTAFVHKHMEMVSITHIDYVVSQIQTFAG
jgi:hypothetical protein